MASIFQLKRSSVSGRIPDAANIEVGEPVVNLADQLLYTKDGSGLVKIIGSGKLSNLSDVSNASPADSQVLTWDSTLNKWKPADVTLEGAVSSGYVVDTFTGDGSSNAFILSRDPYNTNSLLVTIQGVKQRPGTDYSITGNVLTFVDAPYNTDSIDVVHLGSGVAGVSSVNGQVGNITITLASVISEGFSVDKFTGNGSTTNYNLSRNPFNINSLLVTIQGVKQRPGTDYTLAGNVLSFVDPPPDTDIIDIVHLGSGVAGVSSINGIEGNVVLTTSNISETTNLYFTNARVYSNVTQLGYASTSDLTTSNVVELNNLYYTNARVYSNVLQLSYATNSNVALKANIADLTTANVAELNNLYYTNARVYSNVLQLGYATNSNVALKANIADLTTANLTELTNLFYTDARVYSNVRQIGYATNSNVALKSNIADLTTANVTELTNLYFTDARVYSNVTQIGYATNANVSLKANITDLTSANIAELTNLYFTNERVYSNVVQIGYATNSNVNLKANVADLNTSNVVEGNNLYYTNARSRAAISVTGQASYDSATGIINVNTNIFPSGDYGNLDSILDAFGVVAGTEFDCNSPGAIIEIDLEVLA